MLWQRTLQIYGLPATNLMRTETYGLIAKYFDTYFGLDSIFDETPIVYLDLRYKKEFFAMLQVIIVKKNMRVRDEKKNKNKKE